MCYNILDIFELYDPPLRYRVRTINEEFVECLSQRMIEKNSISVDNAPNVIGMIDMDMKDFKEEHFSNYKVFVLDGNHSIQAQKEAYSKTKDLLFRY